MTAAPSAFRPEPGRYCIARAGASTTLTQLARSGEVVKAERGYKLPEIGATTAAPR